MLRSSLSVVLNAKISQVLPVQLQTLRWKRKPRKPFWLGTAKSKKFIIHERPDLPTEEVLELRRLHANYKTAMKSIRHYYENVATANARTESLDLVKQEEIDASLKINDEWNAECARMRAERLAKSNADYEKVVQEIMSRREAKKEELEAKIEELVRVEKERSKDFVTRENLDAKIEECLNSVTDYNYAIDLQGNVYTGYESSMKKRDNSEAEKNVAQNN